MATTTSIGSNAGTSYISGLSSGIDWSSIVSQLIAVDQKSVTLVSNQQSNYQAKLQAWQSFNTQLLTLKTAADGLKDPDNFNVFKTVMSTSNSSVKAGDLLSASADTSASPDSYTIKVVNLATAEKLSSGTFADATSALGSSYAGDITINDKTLTVDATDSLTDVAVNINKLNAGVTASVLNFSTTDHRLIITSTTTGAEGISIEAYDPFGWKDVGHTIVDGQDATVKIDGVTVTKSSNNIDDVIPGVTLNLLNADNGSTTINLNVTRDTDTIKKNIQSFVTDYNNVMSYINKQFSYDTTTKTTGGILFGDGTLLSVKSDLTSAITQPIWGVNSQFSILGLAGINLDDKGQLSIDDTTLTNYLQTNFSDIVSLLAGQGTTSSNSLAYVAHTQNSKPGQYTVHIDTAATRSTSTTSDTAVSGTLGGDETLTIKGNIRADISLTQSMSIDDIIDAIKTAVSAQTLAGSAQLQQNDSSPITSGTAWNNIKDAALQNGDVINFSGTDRDGGSVTGSYTINNVATDTVQGLLTAIETAFSNDVTATIDSSGRIVVTDKSSGTSQLALAIGEPSERGLDFCTVLSTNIGGQTGGLAFDITASKDGSDHLVLTNNSYGSKSFTISEDNHLLWNSDQTVNNGTDVAGTINGETATGAGQVLTGKTGNANTEGLSVTYSGTATGDAGTVKLTIGTADLFDRTLFNITDPYSGYVSFKETSLQNSIDTFQTKIDQMNAQVAQKKQQMINEFVAMETALTNIQNQSSWLTSQTTAAANGWKSL